MKKLIQERNPMQDIIVEKRHIDTVRPYWNNPRKNDAAVEAVAASIREYGYVTPIVVDKEGVIIAGHTRYRALIQLGIFDINVIVSDMSEKKAKGFRIIDNKTSELAEWDPMKLVAEIRASDLHGFEVYFPEINLDVPSVASPSHQVTQEQVDKSAAELAGRYDNIAAKRQENIREIYCPHCGAVFETN